MKPIQIPLFILLVSARPVGAQSGNEPTANFQAAKTRALKITPLSFLVGYTALSFEKSLPSGNSLEMKLGLVGLGIPRGGNARGLTATIGCKFINQPSRATGRGGQRSPLQGWYFRPDLTVARYRKSYVERVYRPNAAVPVLLSRSLMLTYVSLVPAIGIQKVGPTGLTADFFLGAGLAAVSPGNGNKIVGQARYGNLISLDRTSGGGTAFALALKLGFLLGLTY